MDARRPCPDSALLAAFLDGSLSGYERTAVVSHLAECPECRAVAMTVVEFQEIEARDALWEQPSEPAPPVPLVAGGVTRWTREKTRAPSLAVSVALAAALAAAAVPIYLVLPHSSPQQAVSTLIEVAEGQRPVEARLTGADVYAPPPSESIVRPTDDRARVQLISAASSVRHTYEDDYAAPSRRAVGVAALLVGDLDEAIATLEIAASAAPDDVTIANDLAAAYYERAQRANRPDDLPAALSAVERVLHRDPAHREALFNRALVISALGLRREAEAAWRAYIARDPESPWTAEAHKRMQAIRPVVTTPSWTAIKSAFEAAPTPADAERAVRYHASAARDYVENDLLKRWVEAATAGDHARADAAFVRFTHLADAFERIAADRLYSDFTRAHAQAQQRRAMPRFVSAHREYLAAIHLANNLLFAEALPALKRAAIGLREWGSPFSTRAEIEVAASLYYAVKYEDAATLLDGVKRRARESRHAILVIRAAWLEGMTAFSLNEYARARNAYEEMLSAASASGDTDQWVMATALLASLHDTLGSSDRAWQHRIDGASRLDDVVSAMTRSLFLFGAAGDSAAAGRHSAALLFHSLLLSGASPVPAATEVQIRAQRSRSLFQTGLEAEARAELARARERLVGVTNHDTRLRIEADILGAEAEVWSRANPARAVAAAERIVALHVLAPGDLRRVRAMLQLAELAIARKNFIEAERFVQAGFRELEAIRKPATVALQLRASDSVWRLYQHATELALRRGDFSAAFTYAERGRVRTTPGRKNWGEAVATVAAVQEALPSRTALLMLTQLDDALQVWAIRHDRVATHAAPISRSRAAILVATQVQEMLRGERSPQGSGELFDTIVRPLASALADAETIVVVADAPYERVAFPGLWDRADDRYLVETHRLLLAPSATAFARSAAAPIVAKPGDRRAAFLSGPGVQASLARANANAMLHAAYGADHVSRRDTATAGDLKQLVVGADIVHLAARVRENTAFPELSQVALSDDPGLRHSGTVFARDIARLPGRSARVITLEQGPPADVSIDTERRLGFSLELVAAGVPAVVSPVVEVDPQSVERTWLDFHRHYASGAAAAESLRNAQLAALSESDRRPGPWATLTVFGSAQ